MSHKLTNHDVSEPRPVVFSLHSWVISNRHVRHIFPPESLELCVWLPPRWGAFGIPLPAPLIGLLCPSRKPRRGSPRRSHLVVCRAVCVRARKGAALVSSEGDPRVYKRRSPVRAGAVRHSEPSGGRNPRRTPARQRIELSSPPQKATAASSHDFTPRVLRFIFSIASNFFFPPTQPQFTFNCLISVFSSKTPRRYAEDPERQLGTI